MVTDRIYLLPLALFILFPATFIISYIISVVLGHVEADFPYISDTGTHIPESCIFGQFLNICAVLFAVCVYVRYKQVHTYYRYHLSGDNIPRLNKIALVLGWIVPIGVSMVANFQETSLFAVHAIGAFLSFGPGTLYLWTNAVLSYLVTPVINTRRMAHIRVVMSIISTSAFLITCIASPLSMAQFHGKDRTKWFPEDGGFTLHVVATAAEWILAITFDAFILTFVKEFQRITVATPQVYLQIEELRTPIPVESTSVEDETAEGTPNPPFKEFLT
uniref:CWH43-like N-terminal domain-containing protein n=1 Tax=Strigamia maritima TaxID=126957 RepID=T1JKQ3_STRMM